jgi:hypothetical protein
MAADRVHEFHAAQVTCAARVHRSKYPEMTFSRFLYNYSYIGLTDKYKSRTTPSVQSAKMHGAVNKKFAVYYV